MNARIRKRIVTVGGFAGGMYINGLLPPGTPWLRAVLTGCGCVAACFLLVLILPQPSKP